MSLTLLGAGRGGGAGGGGGGGGGGGYSPVTALTGLIGWWDASVFGSLTISSGTVVTAADQSGAGNNITGWFGGTGGPAYNATGFNSKPAFVFNAAGNLALTPVSGTFPMGTGNTLTVWYVGTFGGASSARILSYIASGQTRDDNNAASWALNTIGASNDTIQFSRNASGGAFTSTAGNHRVIVTVSSGGVCTVYVDGASLGSTTIAGNWVSSGQFGFGRSMNNGLYWTGPVGEAGIATGFTNSTDVASLDSYLQTKWGL